LREIIGGRVLVEEAEYGWSQKHLHIQNDIVAIALGVGLNQDVISFQTLRRKA
jgi:hypothetical protein